MAPEPLIERLKYLIYDLQRQDIPRGNWELAQPITLRSSAPRQQRVIARSCPSFAAASKKIGSGTAGIDTLAHAADARSTLIFLLHAQRQFSAIRICRTAGNARSPRILPARSTQKTACCIPRTSTAALWSHQV
jgi:hypothetical protein